MPRKSNLRKKPQRRATLQTVVDKLEELGTLIANSNTTRLGYNPDRNSGAGLPVSINRPKPLVQNEATVDYMFLSLRDVILPSSTREFIDSLYHGYSIYGQLTTAQEDALTRNYHRFC